jgi:hypothetical protein
MATSVMVMFAVIWPQELVGSCSPGCRPEIGPRLGVEIRAVDGHLLVVGGLLCRAGSHGAGTGADIQETSGETVASLPLASPPPPGKPDLVLRLVGSLAGSRGVLLVSTPGVVP